MELGKHDKSQPVLRFMSLHMKSYGEKWEGSKVGKRGRFYWILKLKVGTVRKYAKLILKTWNCPSLYIQMTVCGLHTNSLVQQAQHLKLWELHYVSKKHAGHGSHTRKLFSLKWAL